MRGAHAQPRLPAAVLRGEGKLSFESAAGSARDAPAFDQYVSDPASPALSPTPIRLGVGWTTWLVEDRALRASRA